MHLDVVSRVRGAEGKTFRVFSLNGRSVIGVNPNEPFSLRLRNEDTPYQTFVAYDGIDVRTGDATNGKNPTALVKANEDITFADILGAPLVFGAVPDDILPFDRFDIAPLGCISVGIYDQSARDASRATAQRFLRVHYANWVNLAILLMDQNTDSSPGRSSKRNRRQARTPVSSGMNRFV